MSSDVQNAEPVKNELDFQTNPIELSLVEKMLLWPIKGKETQFAKIAYYLRHLDVCTRCIFRYIGISDIKFYREELNV